MMCFEESVFTCFLMEYTIPIFCTFICFGFIFFTLVFVYLLLTGKYNDS